MKLHSLPHHDIATFNEMGDLNYSHVPDEEKKHFAKLHTVRPTTQVKKYVLEHASNISYFSVDVDVKHKWCKPEMLTPRYARCLDSVFTHVLQGHVKLKKYGSYLLRVLQCVRSVLLTQL